MCKKEEVLQIVQDENEKLQKKLKEENYKLYVEMSNLVHKTAPKTDNRLKALEENQNNMIEGFKDVADEIKNNTEELKKVKPILDAWTTIINTKKGLMFFASIITAITVITISFLQLKGFWIKKG